MKTDKERKELAQNIYYETSYIDDTIVVELIKEYEQPYIDRIKELEDVLKKFTILDENYYSEFKGFIQRAKEILKK